MAKMKDRIEIIVTLQKKETRSCITYEPVEVNQLVRCYDCKLYGTDRCAMYDSRYKIGGNSLDDFCSWGAWTKRKETEQ